VVLLWRLCFSIATKPETFNDVATILSLTSESFVFICECTQRSTVALNTRKSGGVRSPTLHHSFSLGFTITCVCIYSKKHFLFATCAVRERTRPLCHTIKIQLAKYTHRTYFYDVNGARAAKPFAIARVFFFALAHQKVSSLGNFYVPQRKLFQQHHQDM